MTWGQGLPVAASSLGALRSTIHLPCECFLCSGGYQDSQLPLPSRWGIGCPTAIAPGLPVGGYSAPEHRKNSQLGLDVYWACLHLSPSPAAVGEGDLGYSATAAGNNWNCSTKSLSHGHQSCLSHCSRLSPFLCLWLANNSSPTNSNSAGSWNKASPEGGVPGRGQRPAPEKRLPRPVGWGWLLGPRAAG